MSTFADDKAPICIPFITQLLQTHRTKSPDRPLIIGLNGMQGVGKTTLVAPLAAALNARGIHTLVFSIDDFYLPHDEQVRLAASHPENALVQHRGEPGTHDVPLAKAVFASLLNNLPTSIPQYDKALFSGQGDRLPPSQWRPANHPGQPPVQVVIFEGWCVGFRSVPAAQVEAKWKGPSRTLHKHKLEHLQFVNEELSNYDALTDSFDAFIHIDSEDAEYVYAWRQEQEDSLRATRGDPTAGMTPEQVVRFVDGYYPAYELYTDGMRRGIFKDRPECQLRMIVGRDRKVKEVVRI
ncbi:uncharacterized protein G6M90_00g024940 [Metarhizium brunneum]|uniref:Signal recognition particle, SRP54 subunit, GTPase n=3 Tax=Metarhizium TaxID=5529 RepID=E9EYM0_METRA